MRAAATLSGLAVLALLAGCSTTSSDGDAIAHERAETAMLDILDRLTPVWADARDADFLAVSAAETTTDNVTVEPLAWSGNSAVGQGGALLDLRITVHIDAHQGSGGLYGDPSYSAGDSVRCWEVRIFARNYDEYELREHACASEPAPPLPTPTPLPTMPEDTEQRITDALATATAADFADRLRAAFPDPRITIDTIEEDGELIAAVGLPGGDKCHVGVRHADGAVEVLRGWPPEWLLPGETGCRVGLYLNPPR